VTDPPLHVVATAGHVDHGKSSLIVRLTGIDPDRWEEEKRRGLTIDLGFAWGPLPSGREIGFVDVPGHERFVRNMLAGVGPVRLVLFVVAADEGWKPQSEEHLAIVDVLGAHAGVVALTKADLVDEETLSLAEEEVRDRLAGTALEAAAVVACSSVSGRGIDELGAALDDMVAAAPPPPETRRPRLDIDRSFTIRGAGTVVTGTLTGGTLTGGDEVVIHPAGVSARIRGLQSHRRTVEAARPVSRVAVNLAATSLQQAARGDVLAHPGQWRPTTTIEVSIRPVRSVRRPLTARGAYKLYAGTAERDARVRLYGDDEVRPGAAAFARIRLSRPMVAGAGDRFVLRDAGRRETVAGGVILDTMPPPRPGPDPAGRLHRREETAPHDLAALIVEERGRVGADDLLALAGEAPREVPGAERVGRWWVDRNVLRRSEEAVRGSLVVYHHEHPLRPGMEAAELRRTAELDDLGGEVVDRMARQGVVSRDGTLVRLASHRVSLGEREEEAHRLVEAVASGEPTPPTQRDLAVAGFSRDLVEACLATGRLVRASAEVLLTPGFARRAEEVAREEAAGPDGLTVSRFREVLGTSRKYAVPILEWLDGRGVTRRRGDVRLPGAAAG
jgi:selenocysteine-specific elongation factor